MRWVGGWFTGGEETDVEGGCVHVRPWGWVGASRSYLVREDLSIGGVEEERGQGCEVVVAAAARRGEREDGRTWRERMMRSKSLSIRFVTM